mmetsp:Transcript_106232/g.297399  ORF Transcript_106232/g.297399 Transcript_106232/m.297399 type:complete len:296 (+) Transcript_106232:107-994(+)
MGCVVALLLLALVLLLLLGEDLHDVQPVAPDVLHPCPPSPVRRRRRSSLLDELEGPGDVIHPLLALLAAAQVPVRVPLEALPPIRLLGLGKARALRKAQQLVRVGGGLRRDAVDVDDPGGVQQPRRVNDRADASAEQRAQREGHLAQLPAARVVRRVRCGVLVVETPHVHRDHDRVDHPACAAEVAGPSREDSMKDAPQVEVVRAEEAERQPQDIGRQHPLLGLQLARAGDKGRVGAGGLGLRFSPPAPAAALRQAAVPEEEDNADEVKDAHDHRDKVILRPCAVEVVLQVLHAQ